MTDFTGSNYQDFKDQLKNDPMKVNEILSNPYCGCGLETDKTDAWGMSKCEHCLKSYHSSSVDNSEIDDHNDFEYRKATR